MSEYARERSGAGGDGGHQLAPVRAVERSPADAVAILEREVDAVERAIGELHVAHTANEPERWSSVRRQLDDLIAATSRRLERARDHDVEPALVSRIADHATRLVQHRAAAAQQTTPPTGLAVVSCEAELVRILAAPITGAAAVGFAQKEEAIRITVEGLDATESRALALRLRRARPNDALAAAFGGLTIERRDRILAFLDGSRRRAAIRSERAHRLPFATEIQASFGRHDISNVRAEVGGDAGAKAVTLGARAFATGDLVGFREAPDLHTAAHEAAHVIQQRGGAVTAALDTPGDALEQHADAVADAVVRGASAEALLDGATGGGTRAGAIQRKAAQPEEASGIPAGRDFVVDASALTMVARRSWLEQDPAFAATERAPAKVLEMLEAIQRQGGISWATPEALRELAKARAHVVKRADVIYYIGAASFRTIGLPPDSSAMVVRRGDGLDVVVRVDGVPAGVSLPLSNADVGRVLDAVEVFTGLAVAPELRAHTFTARADRGAGVVVIELSAASMRRLVGATAWTAWSKRGASVGRAPLSVAHELLPAETARVIAWLDANVPAGAQRGEPTRALLALVDEIDGHPATRGAVLAYLRSHRGDDRVDEFALRGAIDAARYDKERTDLGLATLVAPTQSLATEQPLPARMTQHRGLVLDGASVSLVVEVDWPHVMLSGPAERAFADRSWHAEVEWVFEREHQPGTRRVERTTHAHDIELTTRFQLAPHEDAGTWVAHAFVRTTHFAPLHLTTLIEVKSEAARMAELRREALGGAAVEEHDGRFTGAGFDVRTPAERAIARQREIDLYDRTAAYLESRRDPIHDDAIRTIHQQNDLRREQDRAIANDQAAGWRTFDMRATYLSKTDGIPSGPLDIYGTVRRAHLAGLPMVEVRLRDLSRRYEQEVFTFGAKAPTFELALHAAFIDLAKDYPHGRVAAFAEEQDPAGATATGRTLGFERDTYSAWRQVSKVVFHPLLQLGIAAASAAVAIFVPGAAPVVLAVNAVNATVQSVDDMLTRADNGTLSLSHVTMDMGAIALSVLPALGSLPVVRASGRAMFALKLADKAGQVLMIGLQAKETLARLEAEDVAAIGAMYGELLALQKSTHASDPRLAKLQAEIEARAAKVRFRLAEAFSQTVGQQLIFMAPGEILHHGIGEAGRTRGPREVTFHDEEDREPTRAKKRASREEEATAAYEAPARGGGDPVAHLGLQLANVVGDAHYVGGGAFRLTTDRGAIVVEIRRTSGAARIVRGEHGAVLEIPRGLAGIDLERTVVGKLTELRHQELRLARGDKASAASDLGAKGTGKHLSPADMAAIAELRLLRLREREQQGTASGAALELQIEELEARLGLHGDTIEAAQRRRAVDVQVMVQDDAARRNRVAKELDGTKGHPGIELHNHLFGIVQAETFRKRAAVATGGVDSGSWIPLLDAIAALDGAEFKHETGSSDEIVRRATAGDAVKIAQDARIQATVLQRRARRSPADAAALLGAAELMAREAAETALSATQETDYNSAYEVRDALIKATFGVPVKEGDTADARRQSAYDDYLREAILQLAEDGVAYSEQSASIKKAGGVASPARIQAAIDQLIAEGKLAPGQVDIRLLAMTVTYHFGERNPALPPTSTPKRDLAALGRDVDETRRQMGAPGTVGQDIASLEVYDWDPAGGQSLEDIARKFIARAKRTGSPGVLRPHLGEGVVDNLAGRPFHTDHDRVIVGDEPAHYARSRNNIEVALTALEALQHKGMLDPTLLIVRFGHVTHATPEQAVRMRNLGIIAEVQLGSNVATGSVSQTDGVHGQRGPAERLDDHAFATLLFYDAQIVLSTDAGAVMSTNLAAEYARAELVIEEVLAGSRTVRVLDADAIGRGAEIPGDPTHRALAVTDMTAAELGRFLHGYEKLFADAQRYYKRRPKPRAIGANATSTASPIGGAHHVDLAVKYGLVPSKGTAIYEGVRADVVAAASAYRTAGYHVTEAELAGKRVMITVASDDREFATVLQSWAGDGPAYLPVADRGVLDRPMTNDQARDWYHAQLSRIAALDDAWMVEGIPLEERARRAFEIRHHARLATREMMASAGDVATLNVRDTALYGDPDGPADFESFVASKTDMTREQAYRSILDSAHRSNPGYDRRCGGKETPK